MPVLDIAESDLSPPSARAWVHLGAVMLWPNDAAQRAQAEQSLIAEQAIARFSALRAEERATAPDDFINEFLRMTLGAAPPAQINRAVPAAFNHGTLAGMVLWLAVERQWKLTTIKAELAQNIGVSEATVQLQWNQYRPVAHLWCAFFASDARRFPCELAELPDFLRRAEVFRCRGEGYRPHQAPTGTLLRPGETWRLARL
jgi:hypothetical protein